MKSRSLRVRVPLTNICSEGSSSRACPSSVLLASNSASVAFARSEVISVLSDRPHTTIFCANTPSREAVSQHSTKVCLRRRSSVWPGLLPLPSRVKRFLVGRHTFCAMMNISRLSSMERTSSEEEEWLLWMREKSSIITVPLSGRLRSTTRGKRLFLHSAMQACSSTGAMSDTWQTQRAAVRKEPLSDVMHLDRSKSCLSIIDLPLPAPPVTTKAAPPRSIIAACSSRYAAPVEVGMVSAEGGWRSVV
mmetsp:Transcript_13578/g.30423  ORF Transcript_13578/g.30423 Transcript_13578/m.30423 type:complete len:248 (-) Transcript_13578:2695-3438(-)